MATEQTIQQDLQDYLDGLCSPEKAAEIENKLATHPDWLREFEAFTDLDAILKSPNQMMEPSVRFTKNVMESIEGLQVAKPIKMNQFLWIFRIASGLLSAILIMILGYSISLTDFSLEVSGSNSPIPSMAMPEVNWSKYLGQETTLALFMICTILGFYLVDKLVGKKSLKHL